MNVGRENRLIAGERQGGDDAAAAAGGDTAIRPGKLAEFIGQPKLKANLEVFIRAARGRRESLDHLLLYGPPGLGKTTLAHIMASEMGGGFRTTSGPIIDKAGDLAALLTNLTEGDVLFVDEVHRLNPAVEEILYPAMEDFQLDILIGEGPSARSIKIDLPRFTLVGATTRAGMLTSPLRDRFGILARLEFYTPDELVTIIRRSAEILGIKLDQSGAREIASRSRGTPRVANRLLRRVRDFAQVLESGHIDQPCANKALALLDVDHRGLDAMDHRLLTTLIHKFGGGPTGIDTLSAAIGEERDTIEEVIEPYLIQEGLIERTPRGRKATPAAFQHLGHTAL